MAKPGTKEDHLLYFHDAALGHLPILESIAHANWNFPSLGAANFHRSFFSSPRSGKLCLLPFSCTLGPLANLNSQGGHPCLIRFQVQLRLARIHALPS